MLHALVTGADGFIGQHLVAALLRHNYRVSGVGRRQPVAGLCQRYETLALTSAQLSEVDVIFHLAGLAHAATLDATVARLTEVNVAASEQLCRAAMAAGVGQFVHLSSIKVLGDSSGEEEFSPQHNKRPQDPYAVSKAAAEDALQTLVQQQGGALRLHIVRPPLSYGPGVKANYLKLLRLALSRWPLPLAGAVAPRAWLGVDNLCSFLIHLAEANAVTDVWHVRDREQSSVSHMLALMSGDQCRQWTLPGVVPFGRLLGLGAQLDRLFLPLRVNMQASLEQLGWQPPVTQAQAVAETVRWYQQQA